MPYNKEVTWTQVLQNEHKNNVNTYYKIQYIMKYAYAQHVFDVYCALQVPSTGEEESLVVVQSYDDLSRKLWRLEGLPLSITAVQGAHPALRYTQVKPLSLTSNKI